MSEALAKTDPTFTPSEAPSAFERWATGFIKDRRDVPFISLMLQIGLIQISFAIALFVVPDFPWWLGCIYLAVMAFGFLDRFMLMLHNTSHRRLFDRDHAWGNHIIPWIIAPFMGQTPMTYYTHHIGMHHPENNLEDDLSSTMKYQRDSFVHFLRYFGRFFFFGILELTNYHRKRGRTRLMRKTLIGELSWYAVVVALMFVRPEATLFVFVIPFVFIRFLMMAGNWGQHAFVDAKDPASPYLNSITCINARYNQRCFNDGYHIGHHVKPNRHWTDMPVAFNKDRERYADEGALVFEGIDFFIVWLALMTKRHRWLASKVVMCGRHDLDQATVLAQMRSRLAPIRR